MRILIICNNKQEEEKIKNILTKNNIACTENLIFEYSFENANWVIQKHLVFGNGHIDLLIITNNVPFENGKQHLVDQIRWSHQEYSNSNFKLCSLPIIYYGSDIRTTDFIRYGYNALVAASMNDDHSSLLKSIRSVVQKFRCSLFDDLELLRIHYSDLQAGLSVDFDPYYMLRIQPDPEYWESKTVILSKQFIKKPKRLNYDWLKKNSSLIEYSIDRYTTILKSVDKYDRKNSEKSIFHQLFNECPWLLQMDLYKTPIYEPALMKSKMTYEEPDYVLPSGLPGLIANNITEVKLPTLELLHKRRRKPGLKMVAHDAFGQLAEYKRYVSKNRGKKHLQQLVVNKGRTSFTLLASNEEEKSKNSNRLKELLDDHYKNLKLITHQEKLQEAIDYFERKVWMN